MLQLSDITCRVAGRTLLDNASAAIPTGARVGFVGRNGTGKTTLFRIINGELQPESGTAKLPLELQYFSSRTVAGSGGNVSKLSIHQVQIRYYPRR